jgi:IgA Peptidase M64/Ricin-type beta-trefoil lectin domain-like
MVMFDMSAVLGDSRGPAAIRMMFEYDDAGIRVVARQRLAKLALPSDPVTGYDAQQGFWVELRTSDQRTVYRRIMEDPFSQYLEVFSLDPERSIVRQQGNNHGRGMFIVEVPDAREADRLVVFSSAAPRLGCASASRPAIEVAQALLREGKEPRVAGSDGSLLGTTRLTSNGFPAWNIVILGDGYQRGELDTFRADVQNFVDSFFATWPYAGLRRAIDVFRVDVASIDSWGEGSSSANAVPVTWRTYFDTDFRLHGVSRVLAGNSATVVSTVNEVVPCWDVAIVLVNSTAYGGSADRGNRVVYCSMAPRAREIVFHQLGHIGFGLGDEYCHVSGCGSDADHESHPLFEPASANVTVTTSPIKWARHVTASPTPRTSNRDCGVCDPQPNPFDARTVGLFEGAATYRCRAYRSQYNCRMRTLGEAYCAVCQDRILTSLADRLPAGLVVCRRSGWVMQVAGASTSDNVLVQHCPPQNTANQRFRFEPRVDGFYRVQTGLRRSPSGTPVVLVLDVAGASMTPGARIQQYAQNGGVNQEFALDPLGDGYFRIIARHSGLVVEVAEGSPRMGLPLQQAIWTGGANQQWIPFVHTESGWRRCDKCQGLFFGVSPDAACPAGGRHNESRGAKYVLGRDLPLLAGWEPDWRCCRRCRALFFGGTSGSVCPMGGPHDDSASGDFTLPLNPHEWRASSYWRRCRQCQALFYGGSSRPYCPAGRAHQARDNVSYSLMLG